MKVNMTPNPLDVVTIHASQGDTEARQWEFELHNNGELIDTSDVKEQMVFKAYKGGTEQLLPENTSTPTTSPFKGDIRYPQGLLTDQEFTYRQSPTESDGLAKITDIKGNTLVWNQLVQNGNFADTSGTGFGVVQGTVSYANNTATVVPNVSTDQPVFRVNQTISVANHRMLLMAETSEQIITFVAYTSGWTEIVATNDIIRVGNRNFIFFTPSSATSIHYLRFNSGLTSIAIKNVMCFDLTQMGLDISSPSDFTSLFNLPYYTYNAGTLLSFNGTGIKTVGKNLYTATYRETFTGNGVTFTYIGEGRYIANGTAENTGWLSLSTNASNFVHQINLPRGTYTFSVGTDKLKVYTYASSDLAIVSQGEGKTTIVDSPLYGVRMLIPSGTVFDNTEIHMQIEFGETATEYESYISNTTSLPISTYFPTGMKSAGSVYDELTESKAITRIGAVDLGSLNWQLERANYNVFLAGVQSYIKPPVDNNTVANIKCALYSSDTNNNVYGYNVDKAISVSSGGALRIRDTSFSDVNTFKQSLSGVYLYYEMVAETETSFTTASLVTENGEIPLSNNDGVLIGKCTEELSAEPGFHDAKIKLSDSDGTCYSNKLQLHVERSPQ